MQTLFLDTHIWNYLVENDKYSTNQLSQARKRLIEGVQDDAWFKAGRDHTQKRQKEKDKYAVHLGENESVPEFIRTFDFKMNSGDDIPKAHKDSLGREIRLL